MNFTPSLMSDVIKVGFVLSLAVSFPLVIFPCRASLFSLLFKRVNLNISFSFYNGCYVTLVSGMQRTVACNTSITSMNFITFYHA
jgi:hypothetical protein